MNKFSVINNELLPASEAAILITDLAVQRGYGIFDFFKTINNRPVFLDDHLDRFFNSAVAMRLTVYHTREELKSSFDKLIARNQIPDSGIRITLTGGYSDDGYQIASPNIIITQQALSLPQSINDDGIKLVTYQYQRQFAHAKTLDYLMAVWLQPVIKQQGADDVLYYNSETVTECPRANFFIVNSEGQLLTTRDKMLKGVIRKQVLDIAAKHSLVKDADIVPGDLLDCKEAFITSTTKNILPVTFIDGRVIGSGKAGPVTRMLAEELERRIRTDSYTYPVCATIP